MKVAIGQVAADRDWQANGETCLTYDGGRRAGECARFGAAGRCPGMRHRRSGSGSGGTTCASRLRCWWRVRYVYRAYFRMIPTGRWRIFRQLPKCQCLVRCSTSVSYSFPTVVLPVGSIHAWAWRLRFVPGRAAICIPHVHRRELFVREVRQSSSAFARLSLNDQECYPYSLENDEYLDEQNANRQK